MFENYTSYFRWKIEDNFSILWWTCGYLDNINDVVSAFRCSFFRRIPPIFLNWDTNYSQIRISLTLWSLQKCPHNTSCTCLWEIFEKFEFYQKFSFVVIDKFEMFRFRPKLNDLGRSAGYLAVFYICVIYIMLFNKHSQC